MTEKLSFGSSGPQRGDDSVCTHPLQSDGDGCTLEPIWNRAPPDYAKSFLSVSSVNESVSPDVFHTQLN